MQAVNIIIKLNNCLLFNETTLYRLQTVFKLKQEPAIFRRASQT